MTTPRNPPPHWCQNLRWKGYHADQEDLGRVMEVFDGGLVIYNCVTTQQPFGCDDGPVAPERCSPERACYQQHRNLRLRVLTA
jgi:hypothetical protein